MIALALVLDALFGEPKWLWDRLPHPAVVIGRTIGRAELWLNHDGARKAKGVLLVVGLLIVSLLIGGALSWLPWPLQAVIAAILLAQRSLADHVQAVADALRLSLSDGRLAVAMIVGRDTAEMDGSAVARSAIESAAENLSDGVTAPLFWLAIGGLPGMFAYKAINTADSMIGYRTPRHEDFGWAAARLDDLVNLIPARLTALLILLTQGGLRHWRDVRREAPRHRSPNAGWPESALARSQGIALSGPRTYEGELRDFPFVNGSGKRSLAPTDIEAAINVLWRVWAACLALALIYSLF